MDSHSFMDRARRRRRFSPGGCVRIPNRALIIRARKALRLKKELLSIYWCDEIDFGGAVWLFSLKAGGAESERLTVRHLLSHKYLMWFFAATYLLSGLSCLEGLVLCVGHYGHLAVEEPHQSYSHHSGHHDEPLAVADSEKEHSEPCRDIHFARGAGEAVLPGSRTDGDRLTRQFRSFSPLSVVDQPFSPRYFSTIHRARASADAIPSASILSSIVLII